MDNTIAKALLQSLPYPNFPFSGGWLFDYALQPARAEHIRLSPRWSFRSAHRIPIDGQEGEDGVTSAAEPDSPEDEDVEMEDDEPEMAEGQDVKMGDDE